MTLRRISLERRGPVCLVGLDRAPKRNAFDLQMYAELGEALGDLQRDARLRCGVLFAHGEHFTGGIELPQWLPHFRDGRMPPLPDGALDPLARDPARTLSKPLVATSWTERWPSRKPSRGNPRSAFRPRSPRHGWRCARANAAPSNACFPICSG